MSAHHEALVVSGAHVQMGVKLAVFGGNGAGQGYDLIHPFKVVGVIFLLRGIEHAHGEVVHGAQRLHGSEGDVLRLGHGLKLFENLFSLVDAEKDRVVESFVLHRHTPFCFAISEKSPPAFCRQACFG